MNVGARLRALRERKGWSQEQLAVQARRHISAADSRAGGRLARTTISKIENGHRLPDLWVLEACAKALGVEVGALLSDLPTLSESRVTYEIIAPPWPVRVTELAARLGRLPGDLLARVLDVIDGLLSLAEGGNGGAEDAEVRQLVRLLDQMPAERREYWRQQIEAEAAAESGPTARAA